MLYTRPLPPAECYAAISFDVFDTLITRTWHTPADQFRAVGHRLREAGLFSRSADEWYRYRMDVETRVRASAGSEEVSLAEIFAAASAEFGWNGEQTASALAIELAQEMRDIRPIVAAREAMAEAARSSRAVIISDTYFSDENLHALLSKCGYEIEPRDAFVSSRLRLTKRTGSIFPAVTRSLGISPGQLCHVGDHPWSDGRMPAKIGIGSRIIDAYLPTRFELALAASDPANAFVASAAAGCARSSRLSRSFNDARSAALWKVSTNVAGPLLFCYVAWVLQRALNDGFKRIYFLSRDGEIMFQIARHVCLWANLDIECRYLYTSRQSYMLPATTAVDDRALSWILKWPNVSTVRSILKRVEVQPDEIAQELAAAGLDARACDTVLSDDDIAKLRALFGQQSVRERILANAKSQRALVIAYLRQEGLFDTNEVAICDVGWQGSIQRCLIDLLATEPGRRPSIKGFYFGLDTAGLKVPSSDAEAYTEGPIDHLIWMIEAFCAGTEGSVARFRQTPTGIEPVLSTPRDEVHVKWGADLQRAGIVKFADELLATLDARDVTLSDLVQTLRPRSAAALDMFMTEPGRGEADAYGSLASSAVPTHDAILEGAPKLVFSRLARWLALRDKSGVPWISWPQGAIRRSAHSSIDRSALKGLFQLRNMLDRRRTSNAG